jgi:hypothetical protein
MARATLLTRAAINMGLRRRFVPEESTLAAGSSRTFGLIFSDFFGSATSSG